MICLLQFIFWKKTKMSTVLLSLPERMPNGCHAGAKLQPSIPLSPAEPQLASFGQFSPANHKQQICSSILRTVYFLRRTKTLSRKTLGLLLISSIGNQTKSIIVCKCSKKCEISLSTADWGFVMVRFLLSFFKSAYLFLLAFCYLLSSGICDTWA